MSVMSCRLNDLNDAIDGMRELVSRLENGKGNVADSLVFWPKLSINHIQTREQLASVVAMMDQPRAANRNGTHWVEGKIGCVEVTAFYRAGLLGKTKKVKVVDREDNPSLAGLV